MHYSWYPVGAPVGSCVVGTKDFIARARWFRKLFGGGMRQIGLLAGCAAYALNHNFLQLSRVHALARKLEAGLRELGTQILSSDTCMVCRSFQPSIVLLNKYGLDLLRPHSPGHRVRRDFRTRRKAFRTNYNQWFKACRSYPNRRSSSRRLARSVQSHRRGEKDCRICSTSRGRKLDRYWKCLPRDLPAAETSVSMNGPLIL